MVEIAIGMPLFLLLIFLLINVSAARDANSAMTMAVGPGIRLGITRGNSNLMGGGLIDGIDNFDWTKSASLQLFMSEGLAGGVSYAQQVYDSNSQAVFGTDFKDLPKAYLYSIAYINQFMKESLGKRVRYPCNPSQDSEDPTIDPRGPGCLLCQFINPAYTGTEDLYDSFGAPPTDRFGIACYYSPDNVVMRGVDHILKVLHIPPLRRKIILRQGFYNLSDGSD